MSEPDPDGLVEVRLIGIPLAIHVHSTEHQAELRREFALIAQADDPDSVPPRLLNLVRRLNQRFGSYSETQLAAMDEAHAQGKESMDLSFRVPPEAGPAAASLRDMLAEADAYCRAGGVLLTLAADESIVRYREWFLGEFVRQARGEPPLPWPGAAPS